MSSTEEVVQQESVSEEAAQQERAPKEVVETGKESVSEDAIEKENERATEEKAPASLIGSVEEANHSEEVLRDPEIGLSSEKLNNSSEQENIEHKSASGEPAHASVANQSNPVKVEKRRSRSRSHGGSRERQRDARSRSRSLHRRSKSPDENSRLYIGGIPREAGDSEIRALFGPFGRVTEISLKGHFAFLEYESREEAEKAVRELHGSLQFGNRRLTVEFTRDNRSGRLRASRGGARESEDRCYECGRSGHWARECPNKRGGSRSADVCFSCGDRGHHARDCPVSKRKYGAISSSYREQSEIPSAGRYGAPYERVGYAVAAPAPHSDYYSRAPYVPGGGGAPRGHSYEMDPYASAYRPPASEGYGQYSGGYAAQPQVQGGARYSDYRRQQSDFRGGQASGISGTDPYGAANVPSMYSSASGNPYAPPGPMGSGAYDQNYGQGTYPNSSMPSGNPDYSYTRRY